MYRHMFRGTGAPSVQSFATYAVPWASELPFIGRVLFRHTLLVYAAFAVVPLTWLLINRTQYGLRLRAAGELPAAVDTAGVDVLFVQVQCDADVRRAGRAGRGGVVDRPAQPVHGSLTAGRGYICARHRLLGRRTRSGLRPRLSSPPRTRCSFASRFSVSSARTRCWASSPTSAIAAMALLVPNLPLPAAMADPTDQSGEINLCPPNHRFRLRRPAVRCHGAPTVCVHVRVIATDYRRALAGGAVTPGQRHYTRRLTCSLRRCLGGPRRRSRLRGADRGHVTITSFSTDRSGAIRAGDPKYFRGVRPAHPWR